MMAIDTSFPLVSVILPVYNAAAHLSETLESVVHQTYRTFEVILIDDGSRDDSLSIARSWQERHPDVMQILQHPGGVNRGVSATRNLGIQRARGKYVAFLDSDDIWFAEKLEHQVALMENDPDIGLSFTQARILRDEHGEKFIPGVEILGGNPPQGGLQVTLIQIINVSLNYIFSTVMVRTDLLRSVGCFNEDLFFQTEDRIMVAKISAYHKIDRLPQVLCAYRAHGTSYTAHALRSGIIPAIFFEMQTSVMVWLAAKKDRRDWARYISRVILPNTFLSALLCSKEPRVRKSAFKYFGKIMARFPYLFPIYAFNAVRHSRIGAFLGINKPDAEVEGPG